MPTDPRQAVGQCNNAHPWSPPLDAWMTGGAGAGNIPATVTSLYPWPPAAISNGGAVTELPQYTPTGVVPTLAGPTFTMASTATPTPTASIDVGSGWTNSADNAGLMVNMANCNYLDPWVGSAAPPSPLCNA